MCPESLGDLGSIDVELKILLGRSEGRVAVAGATVAAVPVGISTGVLDSTASGSVMVAGTAVEDGVLATTRDDSVTNENASASLSVGTGVVVASTIVVVGLPVRIPVAVTLKMSVVSMTPVVVALPEPTVVVSGLPVITVVLAPLPLFGSAVVPLPGRLVGPDASPVVMLVPFPGDWVGPVSPLVIVGVVVGGTSVTVPVPEGPVSEVELRGGMLMGGRRVTLPVSVGFEVTVSTGPVELAVEAGASLLLVIGPRTLQRIPSQVEVGVVVGVAAGSEVAVALPEVAVPLSLDPDGVAESVGAGVSLVLVIGPKTLQRMPSQVEVGVDAGSEVVVALPEVTVALSEVTVPLSLVPDGVVESVGVGVSLVPVIGPKTLQRMPSQVVEAVVVGAVPLSEVALGVVEAVSVTVAVPWTEVESEVVSVTVAVPLTEVEPESVEIAVEESPPVTGPKMLHRRPSQVVEGVAVGVAELSEVVLGIDELSEVALGGDELSEVALGVVEAVPVTVTVPLVEEVSESVEVAVEESAAVEESPPVMGLKMPQRIPSQVDVGVTVTEVV